MNVALDTHLLEGGDVPEGASSTSVIIAWDTVLWQLIRFLYWCL